MVDAVAGEADPESDLQKSTTGPGLLAHGVDSEYAELIDVASEVLPSLATGGLSSAVGIDDLLDLGKAVKSSKKQ